MVLSTPVKVEKPGAAVVITIPTPQSSLKPASAKRRKITDFRLAFALEDNRAIRELLRSGGRLIKWQNEDLVNVITLDALGLNSMVMCVVAEVHCSQTQVVKPPARDFFIFGPWQHSKRSNSARLLQFLNWQHQKQNNSARLPSKMERWVLHWQLRANTFCDFSTPPV